MKPETIKRKAQELLENGTITATFIKELKQSHQQRHEITVDDLIRKLEDIYQKAISGNGRLSKAPKKMIKKSRKQKTSPRLTQ